MKFRIILIILFGSLNAAYLAAQDNSKTIKNSSIKSPSSSVMENTIAISYGSAKWNLDSTKIDSASIIFRDATTHKTVLILVDETAPDSANFRGTYVIRWEIKNKIIPQIYIPPQEMIKNPNWMKEFNLKVASGELKPKPFISRQDEKGLQIYDVFDTNEQAQSAQKAREDEKKLEQQAKAMEENKSNPQMEKVLSQTAASALLDAEKLAEMNVAKLRLAAEEAARAAERARLAQIEKQREDERKRLEAELAAQDKAHRQAEAKKIAQEAISRYKSGEFVKAEELFRKAVDLDPSNTSYYYFYGISLFRNEKYNESIVVLQRAATDSSGFDPVERDYYIGLNYLKLKEHNNALGVFRKIKATQHKTLTPSAAFYEGVILFQTLRYEEAKVPFQEVLDNENSDPKLDAQAEKYLEQIASILYFASQKTKKIFTSTSIGAQYDSNVLYISDYQLDQGTASDVGGFRLLFMGSAQFRPIYEADHEFGSKLGLTYLYSTNAVHATADPFLISLTFPYVTKGTLLDLGSKWDITPGAEVLFMDADSDGTRENLLNSGIMSVGNTLVLNPQRVSIITATVRQDESPTTSDSSAFKVTLATTQMKFLNKERNKIISGDFSYTVNNARGDDYYYIRLDLKGSYITPWKWDSTGIVSLGYFYSDYSKKSVPRSDSNYALNLAMNKKISELWQGTLTANYTLQNSNNVSYSYKKWSLMYVATMNYDF